jgi:hypothetical protein
MAPSNHMRNDLDIELDIDLNIGLNIDLDIDLVFPIKDEVSAWLMCLKAELLFEAGIIDTDEKCTVLERASAILDQAPKQAA